MEQLTIKVVTSNGRFHKPAIVVVRNAVELLSWQTLFSSPLSQGEDEVKENVLLASRSTWRG